MSNATGLFFKISLAQWSLHKALFSNQFSTIDFPEIARNTYGIVVVEYVNLFFMDKAKDAVYLDELLRRCNDNGVINHLLMVDTEGQLASPDRSTRATAVHNHHKWIDAAQRLGCTTVRVNAHGSGSREEMARASVESLSQLGEYAAGAGISIVVENHGGFSSDGSWLAAIMKQVHRANVGTLPDFGNFCLRWDGEGYPHGKCLEQYDRYKGVEEMIPFAKAVSAKSSNFDDQGNCVETDYDKMVQIVRNAGFTGYVGIEYSGEKLSEEQGIRSTKSLLERLGRV